MTDQDKRDPGNDQPKPLQPHERLAKAFRDAEVRYRVVNPDQPKGDNPK